MQVKQKHWIIAFVLLWNGYIAYPQTENSGETASKSAKSTKPAEKHVAANKEHQEDGVAVMTDDAPSYTDETIKPGEVRKFHWKGEQVEIQQRPARYKEQGTGFELTVNSSVSVEQHTALPKIQTEYAQGESSGGHLQWFGPETGEIFSWGPAIRSLEYDGSSYDYDRNGRLVAAGTGNGIPANSYGTGDFFRTGVSVGNNFSLLLPFIGKKPYTEINAGQILRNSPIRNSGYESYNASLAFKKIRIGEVEAEVAGAYNLSKGKLLTSGSNTASIIGALFSTPPTFDNTNGLSAKDAGAGEQSWKLPSGSMRSFSPGISDNPYAFLNALPDEEKGTHLLTNLQVNYKNSMHDGFSFGLRGNYQQYTNNRNTGIPESFAAASSGFRSSVYDLDSRSGEMQLSPSFLITPEKLSFRFFTDYMLYYDRKDLQLNINNTIPDGNKADLYRLSNELKYGVDFKIQGYRKSLAIQFSNRNYFSSTTSDFTNFFPYGGIKAELMDFLDDVFYNLKEFSLFFNAGKSIHEAPLVYTDLSVLSTPLKSENFNRYFEYQFITATNKIQPEIKKEYNAGLTFQLYNFTLNADYFNITTDNFIAPVAQSNRFTLRNTAKVNNSGWNLSAGYFKYIEHQTYLNIDLNWSTFDNRVKSTLDNRYIPLAGFSNISTGMLAGNPFGAIYGTRWMRDNQGRQVIDYDGFPLVDPDIAMIGDPTPNWTAGIHTALNWKKFIFDFTIGISQGGNVWNGTAAALDYLGMSEHTADQRNTQSYIFPGINRLGQENQTPVDFYNPALPVADNRWVRYGFSGVGEEYINDASWIRLSNIGVQYKINPDSDIFKEISVGISGYNLLTFAGYKGVDPSSCLFNNPSGKGLDLFNLPGTRYWMLNLKMNFRN